MLVLLFVSVFVFVFMSVFVSVSVNALLLALRRPVVSLVELLPYGSEAGSASACTILPSPKRPSSFTLAYTASANSSFGTSSTGVCTNL